MPVPSVPLLEASSLGRVRSQPYEQAMPHGGTRIRQMQPTYGVVTYNKRDQLHRKLIVVFRRRTHKVGRLVCEAFNGPPPTPRHVTLHDDEDSMNNLPSNLKWGTQKENLNAPGFIAYCRSRTGENNPRVKGRRAKASMN